MSTEIRPGTKFYQVEWYDTVFKTPPLTDPRLRTITFLRPDQGNEYCGEFIDDTGRGFIYAYSNLKDWWSASAKEAYERHISAINEAIKYTDLEIAKQQRLKEEFNIQFIRTMEKLRLENEKNPSGA